MANEEKSRFPVFESRWANYIMPIEASFSGQEALEERREGTTPDGFRVAFSGIKVTTNPSGNERYHNIYDVNKDPRLTTSKERKYVVDMLMKQKPFGNRATGFWRYDEGQENVVITREELARQLRAAREGDAEDTADKAEAEPAAV